ncbi:MAG: EthD domain-containing protein [Acidimicrobiia bacterium]|nr:EthD domain-containing protein [Acidimicrobiia bacterium]
MPVDPEAQPDTSLLRLQIHLAARGGCREALSARVRDLALAANCGDNVTVTLLTEVADDPFPAANPLCRPFDVVLEVETDSISGLDSFLDAMQDFGDRVADLSHLDLSAALIGAPQKLIQSTPPPLRYLYLMRRKAHSTHAAYIDYYFHNHSNFGFITPNISGYTQFHVDATASSDMAKRLGVGATVVDSVSELSIESLDLFFEGIGDGRLGTEAAEDEARFVDRDNSVSFLCATETIVA